MVDFIYSVGQTFKDDKRNIEILERKYEKGFYKSRPNHNIKFYKCKCHKCNAEDIYISEYDLKQGRGCPVCHGKQLILGINDIPTTAPWMVKYFQGGYEEAKLYTKSSNKKIFPICPDCGKIKTKSVSINKIYQRHGFGCTCSDGISYPEKVMLNILSQLGFDYIYQLSNRNFSWCSSYRYDFYINSLKCIIEVNGKQHYEESGGFMTGLHNIKSTDILKEKIALNNKINHYIKLDCRESNIKFIKNSIVTSELNNLFDISKINWYECEEYATKNIIKQISDFKNQNPTMNPVQMEKHFNVDKATICKYLAVGEKLGWCLYNHGSKFVEVLKDGNSLGIYKSAKYLSDISCSTFGVLFNPELIKRCCRSEISYYKGYQFKYITM